MKVSYNWLNKYFDGKLPAPKEIAEELTFHAWEIEEVEKVGDDTVLDVKVLPDKAMWALSHRGIAKDISVILDLPLVKDPLKTGADLSPITDEFDIKIESVNCRRFAAALVKGVKVGPSPSWLKKSLETIGQRSINNIVDASNYVMFDLGQPSHAFDAKTLLGGIRVRQATQGEKLAALDEKEYSFGIDDTLISTIDDLPLSIAGIKGGKDSGINDQTTDILVEVANWDPVTTRKTAARLKLRSDASSRYENGLVPEMVPFGLKAVVDLILEIAGGELVGFKEVIKKETETATPSVTLDKINSVLGLNLNVKDVTAVLDRFGWSYELDGNNFTVTSPFERTDLVIAEDLIEEVGRIHGYEHVEAVTPAPIKATELNKRFFYGDKIRDILNNLGFSEIYTSSFREHDDVKLANAFAADKGYLRSNLTENMRDALLKNAPNADLLGLKQVRLFEIGTVFGQTGEKFMLALGVQSPSGYKSKTDDVVLNEALKSMSEQLQIKTDGVNEQGVVELDLEEILGQLSEPSVYDTAAKAPEVTYRPFSVYPSMSRDIAMWVGENESEEAIENLLWLKAGDLCVRVSQFDRFQKDNKVSYAYRLVFQSKEKTLESSEVDMVMNDVYQSVRERGFEVR